ncbi:tetratricopeptide repeat protein [Roseovarius aestuarii]|nr:tetratricopeptide repeat protein [Roseovarius aestuarii]
MTSFLTPFRLILTIATVLSLSACAELPLQGSGSKPTSGAASDTLRLAQATANSGDHATAVELFEKALAAAPDSVEALQGAGDSYGRMGQQLRAETVLLRAHELAPRNDEVLTILARVYLAQNLPEKALKNYDKALNINRSNVAALTGKGVALDTMSEHHKAQKAYLTGLGMYPTNFVLRSNYAVSLALVGNSDKAISILQELVRDPNAAPFVRDNLALVYGLAGLENEARATLSLNMEAKDIEHNINIYRAFRRMKQEGKPIGALVLA